MRRQAAARHDEVGLNDLEFALGGLPHHGKTTRCRIWRTEGTAKIRTVPSVAERQEDQSARRNLSASAVLRIGARPASRSGYVAEPDARRRLSPPSIPAAKTVRPRGKI